MFHVTVWSVNPGKHELGHGMLGVHLANHSDRSSAMTHSERHVQSLQRSPSAVLVSVVCSTLWRGKKKNLDVNNGRFGYYFHMTVHFLGS